MPIKAPQEFHDVCERFHQGFILDEEGLAGMFEFAVEECEGEKAKTVREFIDQALSGSHSDDELQELWFSTPADLYFTDGPGLRNALRQISDLLKER